MSSPASAEHEPLPLGKVLVFVRVPMFPSSVEAHVIGRARGPLQEADGWRGSSSSATTSRRGDDLPRGRRR
jgi:hypothetical protein